ncbi:wax ester/triacylglycerol synthase domain-containing protein [Roseateles oligotrophus]|uniref:diacylglycerol O-acyltransferase n=1 Tax=Roseateles oligotrophus TaxID=1769250 RepID=A0ABT2YA60_9BURK|nr:wax ester/triacylglycerol synthase domain-containing protein [Roseateles oligotrophus]MCV2367178.1 WS/DGAT domain-containing protein [Roseateles oligotrophus]
MLKNLTAAAAGAANTRGRDAGLGVHTMSAVDAAWLHMDGPANPAIVVGISLTRVPLDFKRVRAVFKRCADEFDRFRQRVVESGLLFPALTWADMADFEIERHVHRAALPQPGDEAALRALIGELAALPLDRALPLWQVHVVDGCEPRGQGGALIMRYHHCIGDGTAMMALATRLFESAAGRRHKLALPASHLPAHDRPVADLLDKAGLVLAGAGTLLADLLIAPDPPSPFKGKFGLGKRVAWSAPVPIARVKEIGAPTGAKVNDVMVAIASGALRGYLRRRGVDVQHTHLRAMVPIDLRPPEHIGQLGNEFGLAILELPVSNSSARQCLALSKARMDQVKRSPEAIAMHLLFDVFGRGPKLVEDLASHIFGSKASVTLTNVVGPLEQVKLAGSPVERMLFCVPHPGEELGMGISIMIYQGMATLTVIADAHLVPDPEAITRGFNREFDRLCRLLPGLS